MESLRLHVRRSARVHALGPRVDGERAAREVWALLHGYGQLAADFLAQARALDDGARRLLAPEGLSRFYTEGGSGPVGASWMTRESRAEEIEDYVAYLDQAVATELPITALGFSQGAATAARWAALGRRTVGRLVLWGSAFPPDLDLDALSERLARTAITFVRGRRDALVPADAVARDVARLRERGLSVALLEFDGGHRLDDATLRALAQR